MQKSYDQVSNSSSMGMSAQGDYVRQRMSSWKKGHYPFPRKTEDFSTVGCLLHTFYRMLLAVLPRQGQGAKWLSAHPVTFLVKCPLPPGNEYLLILKISLTQRKERRRTQGTERLPSVRLQYYSLVIKRVWVTNSCSTANKQTHLLPFPCRGLALFLLCCWW